MTQVNETMPPANAFFTARQRELVKLRDALVFGSTAAVTQAITGMGGIGKTSLAIAYAYEYQDHYDNLLYCRADSVTSLNTGYKALATQLGLPEAGSDDYATVLESVKRYLNSAVPSDAGIAPYLLILDNADFVDIRPQELRAFLPNKSTGHILLTTRSHRLHTVFGARPGQILHLGVMEEEEAFRFLLQRVYGDIRSAPFEEAMAARELAAELGFLPLALEQSAAYVAAQFQPSFQNYLALYRGKSASRLMYAPMEAGEYENTVATTWQTSFDKVETDSQASADLLRLCAFFAPDAIPVECVLAAASGIVESISEFFGSTENPAEKEDAYNRLIEPLSRYSLVSPGNQPATFDVHRLVQAVTRWQMTPAQQRDWEARAILTLNRAFPGVEFQNWFVCERLTPHVQAVVAREKGVRNTLAETSRLLNQTAFYLNERARYSEAEPLCEEALAIMRQSLPADDPDIATSLNNLAALYNAEGRYSEAESLLMEALAIRRLSLPTGHPDIAASLNNLAALYNNQERYLEAETLLREALTIWRRSLPAEHPNIAAILNNLGHQYNAQRRYAEAKPLLEEALMIRRQSLPFGHPDIAQSLNNMAYYYGAQGNYSEAEPLYREALALRLQSLPAKHPDIATSLHNLAGLYESRGRYVEAEPLYEEALAIRRQSLPAGHPDIAISLNNLAMLYKGQGRYAEAEPLLMESLAILQASLGEKHPNTQTVRNSLMMFQLEKALREKGHTLEDLNKAVEAGLTPEEAMTQFLGE